MKEETMAILSMVEKGVITVDEAERLLAAIKGSSKSEKIENLMSKAGDKLNIFAKKVNKKTEKMINDAKPAIKSASEKMEKVVDDVKPSVKKAAETIYVKADEIKEKIKERKQSNDEDIFEYDDEFDCNDCNDDSKVDDTVAKDSDFEKDVKIIPFEESEDEEKNNN